MDFNSILSLAAQNSSSGNKYQKKFSTDLGPPKKEKKEKTVKSEAVKRLLEEKEREKRKIIEEKERKKKAKEEAVRRKKEKEEQRKKEEEKRNRFRIPKKNAGSEDETGKSGDTKTRTESDKKYKHKHDKNAKSKDKNSKSERRDLVLTPNEVRITALSNHSRESHVNHQYDFLLKKGVDMKIELEKELKRREFEEKRAKLLEKMKEGLLEDKDSTKDKMIKVEREEKRKQEKELKRIEKQRERELNGETVRKRRKGMTDDELKEWLAKGDSDTGEKVDKIVKKERISDHGKPPMSKPSKLNSGMKKPPPLGFGDLLKLAQEKSTDVIDVNPFCPLKPKKVEPERLLTQAEKDRKQDELRHRSEKSRTSHSESTEMRHKSRTLQSDASESKQKSGMSKGESSEMKHKSRTSKGESNEMRRKSQTSQSVAKQDNHNTHQSRKEQDMLEREREILRRERELLEREKEILRKEKEEVRTKSENADKFNGSTKSEMKHSKNSVSKRVSSPVIRDNSSRSKSANFSKHSSNSGGSNRDAIEKSGKYSSSKLAISSTSKSSSKDDSRHYDCENENVLVCGPSKGAEKKAVVDSQNPWDRIYGQIKKNHPVPAKRRRVESFSDESEYDEDMEGFIEDEASDVDEEDVADYSAHIRQIFGYDRRKFRYESDHEIRNMETNFREQMKEEARSARLGLMEDLEDIKREEEEMKRKMQAKKKKK